MTSPVTIELQTKIAGWRQRMAEGTLTREEMKEAVVYLRAGRIAAATASAAKKRKSSAVAPDAAASLDELADL